MMEQLGKVARNGTENLNGFSRELDDLAGKFALDPNPGNLSALKGKMNELTELAAVIDEPGVTLLGTGVKPTVAGTVVKDLDAVAQLTSGQKVIYEFKHGSSFANPSTAQAEKLIRQVTGRVELAKQPGALQGAKIIVRLRGGTWSPSLREKLINLGNSGITIEVVP